MDEGKQRPWLRICWLICASALVVSGCAPTESSGQDTDDVATSETDMEPGDTVPLDSETLQPTDSVVDTDDVATSETDMEPGDTVPLDSETIQQTDSVLDTDDDIGSLPGWILVYHESFEDPFDEPGSWTEDTYGETSDYHVGPFDEDGGFFVERGGQTFLDGLSSFRSFRKSFTYGEDDWLTVELYGRDADLDGVPETGGRFVSDGGTARMISTRHYDGAIIRPTVSLPSEYRIEVTVSDIEVGGKRGSSWSYDGKLNGYSDGDETGDPWRFTNGSPTPLDAYQENGIYFLCITDYERPAPHNNVFIHHHRKVVMDSDNNMGEWSQVFNAETGLIEQDGSHYISMLWLNGEDFGDDWTGNSFVSYIPRETDHLQYGAVMADKYKEGETYLFAIERRGDSYNLEVTGDFHHLGPATMRMSRNFRESPVVWHYNQDAAEYDIPSRNQVKTFNGATFDTWPQGSAYPDYFLFGDPHINYYEGTARYDDLKLYVPE